MTEANRVVSVGNVTFSNDAPFSLIAGPCQLESREHALECAAAIKEITDRLGIGVIYKTSYDKANRTSLAGKRGVGMEEAMPIFAEVKEKFGMPVLTDVHSPEQCAPVAEVVEPEEVLTAVVAHKKPPPFQARVSFMAHSGGFEPPTARFVAEYSIQLSYECVWRRIIRIFFALSSVTSN